MRLVALAFASQLGLVAALSGGRFTAASALLALVGAGAVALEAGAQRGDDPSGAPQADRALGIATSVGVALCLLGAPVALARGAAPSVVGLVLGCVLALSGALLRRAAIATLGQAFVTEARAPDVGLVTHGVFARVRHPSELGLGLLATGMLVAAPSVATALGCALSLGAGALRVRREDRVLAAAYGDAWARWARRAGAIAPRVGAARGSTRLAAPSARAISVPSGRSFSA